jgi:peptidoglycan/LPS O-acetylase OafA/YrhL
MINITPIQLKENYLNQIQILRALSVILIFFFHSNLESFSKGYLGVDIFFIISGYVITKILEEKIFYRNKYKFKEFYIKRILRIAPVYFFIINIFILTFLIIGPLTDLDYIINKIQFIFTFSSNFYYLSHQKEYFDNIFQDPLSHTWSLAVEMQFYFAFPFLYYFLKKNLNQKLIIKVLILIIISSIFFNYYIKNINLTFYSPIFRVWEFLLGSLIYLLHNKKNFYKKKIIKELQNKNYIFLVITFIIIFFLTKNSKFLDLILTAIGTTLFLLFVKKNNSSDLFSNNKLLIYLGNISYSFYLWHLPVLYFFSIYFDGKYISIYALTLTILLSHLSYTFIEKKFKNLKINIKYLLLTALLIILLISIIKINYYEIKNLIVKNNYLEKTYSLTKRINYTEIKINNKQIFPFCTDASKNNQNELNNLNNECLKYTDNKFLVYMEGDSHTAMFAPLILSSKLSDNVYFLNNAKYSFKEVNNELKNFKKIIYVRSINSLEELDAFKINLKNFDNNVYFIIFAPIPNYYNNKIKTVECLIQEKECLFNSNEDFEKRNLSYFYKEIEELKNSNIKNLIYFNPYKILCPNKNCHIYNTSSKILTYRDNNHLTIEGSLLLLKDFNIFIKNNLFFLEFLTM